MGDLRFTAFHEAGHAVADHRFGFRCMGCSIEPDDAEGTAGRAAPGGDDFSFATLAPDGVYDIPAEATRNRITSLYAGYCAAITAGESEARARQGASQDFEQAAQLRAGLPGDVSEHECLAVALVFVCEPQNWRAIELVATELLEHKSLSGDVFEIVVDVADGETTPEALAIYRAAFVNRETTT